MGCENCKECKFEFYKIDARKDKNARPVKINIKKPTKEA